MSGLHAQAPCTGRLESASKAHVSESPNILPMAFRELERFRQLVFATLICCCGVVALDLLIGNSTGLLGAVVFVVGLGLALLTAKSDRMGLATHLYAV